MGEIDVMLLDTGVAQGSHSHTPNDMKNINELDLMVARLCDQAGGYL